LAKILAFRRPAMALVGVPQTKAMLLGASLARRCTTMLEMREEGSSG